MVVVRVGTGETKDFQIHKGLLCYFSGYFRAALSGKWVENSERVLELPTEDISIFAKFAGWLYTTSISDNSEWPTFDEICQVWAFADRREIPMLMNAMINTLSFKVNEEQSFPTEQVGFIYDNTTPEAGLRRLISDMAGRLRYPDQLLTDENRQHWPADAVWDLIKMMCAQTRKRRDKQATAKHPHPLCDFHCHEEGVRCPGVQEVEQQASPVVIDD